MQDGKYTSWKVLSKYSFLTDSSIPLKSDKTTMNPARDTWIAKGYLQKLQSNMKTANDWCATNQSKYQIYKKAFQKHVQKYIWPEVKGVRDLWGSSSEKLLHYSTIRKKSTIAFFLFNFFKIACIVKIESNGRAEVNILSQLLLSHRYSEETAIFYYVKWTLAYSLTSCEYHVRGAQLRQVYTVTIKTVYILSYWWLSY